MEEAQNPVSEEQTVVNPISPIAPPPMAPQKTKKNLGVLIMGAVLLLIIIIVGIFVVRGSGTDTTPSPTPETQGLSAPSTPLPTEAPAEKTNVTVQILNGTGIAGEASYLQGQLKELGYSEITVGNADSTDNIKTTVTYSDTLDETLKTEMTEKLGGIYETVNTDTSSTQTKDIVIITGLRKGQTPAPTKTPAPSASPSAQPSAT